MIPQARNILGESKG
uniref:Uncharacterized protein n=1 Tax=Arundo donax TaxID=35708 RepID=A0A0A8Y5R1_ARUDO